MDSEPKPINRPPREKAARVRAQELAWAVEEKLFWRLGDAGRGAFDLIRRTVERPVWFLQKRVIWPLQYRLAGVGGRGRAALTGGGALVVGGLAVLVIALAGSGGSGEETADRVAVATPAPVKAKPVTKPKPKAEPTLHGAAPSFEREPPRQAEKAPAKEAASSGAPSGGEGSTTTSSSAATAKISSDPSASTSAAAATGGAAAGAVGEDESETIPGRPAGPKAIAVARKFSKAFVVYETAGIESEVRRTFGATTTPELAKALLRRPPRLPADVKVPRAKVVTVVPGPSREGVYTLSVSLLRVGATSELRLEMERLKKEGWRVTNVLG
jgi:hypothetical protein